MKTGICSVPSFGILVTVSVLLLGGSPLCAQQVKASAVHATATLHTDGTRSEAVKDVIKREMTETTYDSRGIVISKKIFLLNEAGDPMQGVIYDGADNLIARVQFFFDDLGRVIEERCVNPQGEIFRRVIRQYDANGKSLAPKAYDYAVNAPNMKPGRINFTNLVPPPDGGGAATSNQVQQPGDAPKIMTVSPRSTAPAKPAEQKPRNPFGSGKR